MHGALRLKQALGSLPEAGRQSYCTCGPKWHLGIWHKKGLLSPGHPPFAAIPHPTPVQAGHLPISLEIGNPALFPEDRGPQERGNPGWRAEEQEHKDTHRPGKQICTQRATCTHSYTNTQALPSARDLGGQVWDQGHLPLCPDPFLFGNRRGRDTP